jgi:hypothetical protein
MHLTVNNIPNRDASEEKVGQKGRDRDKKELERTKCEREGVIGIRFGKRYVRIKR